MVKNSNLDNTLIKRKNLIKILNNKEIRRISPEALEEIEKEVNEEINKLAEILKQKIIIKGKKTLSKEDIEEVRKEKYKSIYPEI